MIVPLASTPRIRYHHFMSSPRAVKAIAVSSCGLEFAVAIGLFTWLGLKADAHFATAPLGVLVGLFLGLGLGGLSLYRTAERLREIERER